MREQTAEVENAGATMYGKPAEENTLKYRRKYGCRGIHAYLLPNATHKRVGLLTSLLSSVATHSNYGLPYTIWQAIM